MRKNCKIAGDNMNVSYFKNLIEQKLLSTHTTYLATVLSMNGEYARIQPLSMVKAVGGESKKQAIIDNVPISQTVLRVLNDGESLVGATVIVSCAERDISRTRKGEFALPSFRMHSLSDSIITGFI